MKQKISHKSSETVSYEKLRDMLNLYQQEFIHRDATMWHLIFKYFYATLIVIFLPNIAGLVKIDLSNIPNNVFRIVGGIMSLVFLYVSLAYAYRLQAVSQTYRELNALLDKPLRRKKIKDMKGGWLFDRSLSYIIPIIIFFSLIVVSIAFVITDK